MRIWLNQIHVPKKYRPEGWKKPLKRHLKCKLAKAVYGVDPRETYDLDETWRMWMYEHLKMYLKKANPVVDLTEHHFEWKGEQYSQLDMIHMMLDRLEFALNPKSGYDDFNEKDYNYIHEAEKIWAIICPAMWW